MTGQAAGTVGLVTGKSGRFSEQVICHFPKDSRLRMAVGDQIIIRSEGIGMVLTESYAMHPAASVSGFYFSHPQSQYFSVGPIGEDQVEDYVKRSGRTEKDVKRTLAPNLG
jgi:hypothetical protein